MFIAHHYPTAYVQQYFKSLSREQQFSEVFQFDDWTISLHQSTKVQVILGVS